MTEPIRRVVEFECRRAREFYRRAADFLPPEDRKHLVAAEIMRAVYFETLERIERSGYDVFTAGARVLVVEARVRLGGRATAFPDRETGELVDNGQHVLLGCYTDTFAFLEDIRAAGNVRVQPQLSVTMIDRGGRRSRLVCPGLPPPWHLLAGVLEWDALGWNDRLSALRMATPLRLALRQAQDEAQPRPVSARRALVPGARRI